MSIQYAILSLLNNRSLTGYDMKKLMQNSAIMPWSGNNNQIYKALVELLEDGCVTNELHHQESAPSKKIYTITRAGKEKLREWSLSPVEPPEFKKLFLLRLTAASQLSNEELLRLITSYEEEIRMQILLHTEQAAPSSPHTSSRERLIQESIQDNIISFFTHELSWAQSLRDSLTNNAKEANGSMNYQVVNKNEKIYLESTPSHPPLRTEEDARELIAACMEHQTSYLLLHAGVLSDEFLNLRTGLAGLVLQKLINYRVKTAVVMDQQLALSKRFQELLSESNKGNDFRVFADKADAEKWLLGE
ncbi:DUF4180 domain-containing protein [Paenibacillus sp. GCM10027626]|uniref:DUF4180 domain-containing protein n=1 Tax=Paenibacillus sp. GCM10027626 TaxID=3273411 RepID=UPI003628FC80